jgi:hypothetical protein
VIWHPMLDDDLRLAFAARRWRGTAASLHARAADPAVTTLAPNEVTCSRLG